MGFPASPGFLRMAAGVLILGAILSGAAAVLVSTFAGFVAGLAAAGFALLLVGLATALRRRGQRDALERERDLEERRRETEERTARRLRGLAGDVRIALAQLQLDRGGEPAIALDPSASLTEPVASMTATSPSQDVPYAAREGDDVPLTGQVSTDTEDELVGTRAQPARRRWARLRVAGGVLIGGAVVAVYAAIGYAQFAGPSGPAPSPQPTAAPSATLAAVASAVASEVPSPAATTASPAISIAPATLTPSFTAPPTASPTARPTASPTARPTASPTQLPTPVIAVTVSPGTIDVGDGFVVAIHWAAKGANRTVVLQSQSGSLPAELENSDWTWTSIATLTTDADGKATYRDQPSDNRFYRVVFGGGSDFARVVSERARGIVRQTLSLQPANNGQIATIAIGTTISFTSTVKPARPLPSVATVTFVVYELTSDTWQPITSQPVSADADGRAEFRYTFATVGRFYVRAAAGPTIMNANSNETPIERYDVI